MNSIKINKIAAVWLLMVVIVVRVSQATPPQLPLEGYIEGKVEIVGDYPKVDEIFEVIYRIRLKRVDDLIRGYLGGDYCAVIRGVPFEAIEIVGKDKFLFTGFAVGEWKEFRSRCQILKPLNQIIIDGDVRPVYQGKVYGPIATEGYLLLYLIDSKTGQYGTKEQWLNRGIGVLGKYNNVEPQWFSEIDPTWAESNRKIVQEMRKFVPALSDSEALCLHQDNYLLIINAVGDPNATDEQRIEHLLEAGWLDAQRSGAEAKETWFREFMEKNHGRWGGNSNLNFFRDNNSIDNYFSSGNNSSPKERITTTFIGTWNYQDHLYNKDNGLLWSYATKPVRTAEVGIRAYWTGQGQIFVGWGSTDSNGNFTITTELIPYGATHVRAFPILYAWGPERYNEKIKVSDPDTSISTWKNPRDRTIWFLPRPTGTPANYVIPGGTCNFGTCYPETATTAITQPRSGAANILETYLHARTFMSPAPTWPLRCLWEPGYDTTGYRSDTIRVSGNYPSNTDEWDDDILLHEFGHYLMDHYAQLPPIVTDIHWWHKEYPNDTSLAYSEGWATFFSGWARVSSGIDSLFINSHYIGAGLPWYWLNIEDPWKGSYFSPDSFQGGPWCEGAVCGVLWDIYDSHDEIPYPSYPDSLNGVWFPDTALADSLTMGFDEIWTVFDDYNPPGDPTNCWTIFHFRAGWNYYNYDHDFALNQIFLHHRIRDSIPTAPIGLSVNQEGKYVRLYWNKNSESDLKGYRVYRRMYNKTWGHWDDWAWRVDKNSPTDTTYLDVNVISTIYRYRVTAYDSLGNESDYSDSVQIEVKNGLEPKSIQLFSQSQTIFSNIQDMEISITQESKEIIFKIYDCCGRIVNKQKIKLNNCDLLKINLRDAKNNHLPNGVYFLHLKADNGDEAIRKFVVIR